MIHYALLCRACGHGFDGWFRSGTEFERQSASGLLQCPACHAPSVGKALMAPSVTKVAATSAAPVRSEAESTPMAMGDAAGGAEAALAKLRELARAVRAGSDYVGPRFAEEARRIHFGEAETRGIYGEASAEQVKSLLEDGIPALPLPPLPEDRN